MAAVFQAGSVYVTDTNAVAVSKACRVAYIIFTPASSGDNITLFDSSSSAATTKMVIKGATAAQTVLIDLSAKPMSFANGVWATMSASGTATLILTSEGAST